MRLKCIYYLGLGRKDVYAILWYEWNDLTHSISQEGPNYVSYVVKRRHLNFSGLRKQNSKVYFYLCKFCRGFGQFSRTIILCVFVGSAVWSLWTLWHLHVNTGFHNGCCKKKVLKGYPSGTKLLCSRSHTRTASAYSSLARRVPWPFLMQAGPGKYGLCVSGNGEDMDTEEP